MGRSRILENYVTIALFSLTLLLTVAIILHLLAVSSEYIFIESLSRVGGFLFGSFHIAAFLIAGYPLFSAVLFLIERSTRTLFFELVASIVPLLCFSIAIHLLVESPASRTPLIAWIHSIFGKNGGIIISSLFTAGGFVGIAQLGDYLRSSEREKPAADTTISRKNSTIQELYRTPTSAPVVHTPEPPAPPPVERKEKPTKTITKERVSHEALVSQPAFHTPAPSFENHIATSQKDLIDQPERYASEDIEETAVPAVSNYHHTQTRAIAPTHPATPRSQSKPTFFLSKGGITTQRPAETVAPAPPPSGTGDGTLTSSPIVSHHRILDWKLEADQLLNHYPQVGKSEIHKRSQLVAEKLREMLQEFNIEAEIVGIRIGPVVTVYEVLPAAGVKVTRVSSLSDNIALRLAAPRVRIEAPIPGKQAIGIEIPNKQRQVVGFDQLVGSDHFQDPAHFLPIALGKDISGEPQIIELTEAPHLLIAGATGSGKSVCVNSVICSLLFHCSPREVRMMLIDPKIVELKLYNEIPHLLTPVITDPHRAVQALDYCLSEMERRYSLLDEFSVRDIAAYNKKIDQAAQGAPLPYIVIVIDEFADLMATAGKKIEALLVRLTAMSRAVGIHLVLATQRPSTDVITGLIKANIPSRISFMVSSKIDSRIILDIGGAEQLLGKGDMLYISARHPHPLRLQGALVTDEEVLRIVKVVREYAPPEYVDEHEIFGEDQYRESSDSDNDPLFEEAVETVRTTGKASASLLQRRLQIGYNRAARLIEEMERQGIVGPPNGSKPREIIKVHS